MAKIKIEKPLYEQVKKVADIVGYASVDEFVAHVLEKELRQLASDDNDPDVLEQLKGLGYIA